MDEELEAVEEALDLDGVVLDPTDSLRARIPPPPPSLDHPPPASSSPRSSFASLRDFP